MMSMGSSVSMSAFGESFQGVCRAKHTDAVMMSSLGMFGSQSSNSKRHCACKLVDQFGACMRIKATQTANLQIWHNYVAATSAV